MSTSSAIVHLLNEYRFEEAVPLADRLLREAAAESPERFTEVARGIVAWRGIFAHTAQAIASEGYFRAVYKLLQELAGPESSGAMAAAENLASILGSIDKVDEAISLRERVFAHVSASYPADDPRFMQVRDGLAFLNRRAGREGMVDELYRKTGLCEHLSGVERYLRNQGGKLVSCGQPWSENCHIWVYFDALLDCERLIQRLALEPCVQIHDHHGTHEGSERGLVCTIHHDAVMGQHPAESGPRTKTFTVV
jgi:hypothetical protein